MTYVAEELDKIIWDLGDLHNYIEDNFLAREVQDAIRFAVNYLGEALDIANQEEI